MARAWQLPSLFICPILLGLGLTACDSPEKRALRNLERAGVQPSGIALLEAVTGRDVEMVGWLLDVGVYTEQENSEGKTPLRIAVENGDLASVFKLLESSVDVNAVAQDDVSILGVAVEKGESAVVDRLLASGANGDGVMKDGENILPWAIKNGRLTTVRSLMHAGADPHLKDRMGSPLLHVAMDRGRRDLVEELIRLGADPGATNAAGKTTLQAAFDRGWIDLVPQLAAAGADPNAVGVDGLTLLDHAVVNNDVKRTALLLRLGADPQHRHSDESVPTPLEQVFALGHSELFSLFLDHGVRPSGGNWDSWLWRAYHLQNAEFARKILAHGAPANSSGPSGYLLMEDAVLSGRGSFVKLLTDYGRTQGRALEIACRVGDAGMVELLLHGGADPNKIDPPSLETPLSFAIRGRRDQVAATLVHYGAEMNWSLPEGQKPFHLAVATGCHRTAKAMLDRGIDPDLSFELPASPDFIRNVRSGVMRWALRKEKNVTPLMVAADTGCIVMASHLIKAGAKKSVRTQNANLWPINFASRRADVQMMRLFLGKDPRQEKRLIEVRLSEQRALLFDGDGRELFSTKVSTGKKGFATPTGEFVITNKHRDWKSTLYHASMPYFQRFSCGDFGFHQGVVPGYPASHGCIRVPAGNAAKLFTMTEAGDRVVIVP